MLKSRVQSRTRFFELLNLDTQDFFRSDTIGGVSFSHNPTAVEFLYVDRHIRAHRGKPEVPSVPRTVDVLAMPAVEIFNSSADLEVEGALH